MKDSALFFTCSIMVSTMTAAALTSAAMSLLQADKCCSTSPVIGPRLNLRFLTTSPEIDDTMLFLVSRLF